MEMGQKQEKGKVRKVEQKEDGLRTTLARVMTFSQPQGEEFKNKSQAESYKHLSMCK